MPVAVVLHGDGDLMEMQLPAAVLQGSQARNTQRSPRMLGTESGHRRAAHNVCSKPEVHVHPHCVRCAAQTHSSGFPNVFGLAVHSASLAEVEDGSNVSGTEQISAA